MRSNILLASCAALLLTTAGGAYAVAQTAATTADATKDAKAEAKDAKKEAGVAKSKAKVAVKKAKVASKKAAEAAKVADVVVDKETLIKNRIDFMKAQAADNKAIGDYAKGMGSKEAATAAINDIIARNPKLVALFIPGTSSKDYPGKSNAKPEIWSDHDHFAAISKTLLETAQKEADVIKTGTPEEVGAAQANLGKVGCGACHGPFREKLPG